MFSLFFLKLYRRSLGIYVIHLSFASRVRLLFSSIFKGGHVVYCIVLYWKGGHCCSIHCDLVKIYCAPSNLCITKTWICGLNFAQRPSFSGLRFFNVNVIPDSDFQLKLPPEDEHVTLRLPWPTSCGIYAIYSPSVEFCRRSFSNFPKRYSEFSAQCCCYFFCNFLGDNVI